jgi:hypothetical protein
MNASHGGFLSDIYLAGPWSPDQFHGVPLASLPATDGSIPSRPCLAAAVAGSISGKSALAITAINRDTSFRETRECPMDRIEHFQTVLAVVDKGSLTAAAKQLGRSL